MVVVQSNRVRTSPAVYIGAAALALSLTACGAFGPDRDPPKLPATAHYSVDPEPAQLPAADGMVQRLDFNGRPPAQWWQAYQSAALDALVEEGLANSPSLAAAQHTLKAAREALRSQIGQSMVPSVDVGFDPAAPAGARHSDLAAGADLPVRRLCRAKCRPRTPSISSARRCSPTGRWRCKSSSRPISSNRPGGRLRRISWSRPSMPPHCRSKSPRRNRLVALGEQRAGQTAARYQLGGASHDDMLAAEQDAADAAATLPALRAQASRGASRGGGAAGAYAGSGRPCPCPWTRCIFRERVPVAVPSELLHQRPDILAAEANVRAAADEAGAAAASMFPSLTLSAAYGRGGFDWSTFTSPAGAIWSVGASLTQPLFHGGALVARKHQYEATYDAAVAQYKQTVLAAFQNVADTLVSLDEDANTLAQAERAANAAHCHAA